MQFTETAWKGFRNLKPRRQQWCPGLNILFGPNGSGKTNLLESFNVLSGWGAFAALGNRTSFLVAWNAESGRALLAGRAEGERDLEVQAQIGTRMSLRAANERTTYSELRLLLPSLSFLAHDIDLLDGSPSTRRLFIDKLCALFSPLYARRLAEYRQLARHRTTLLRQKKWDAAALRATVTPIVQLGGWIRAGRRKVVGLLSKALLEEREVLPFSVSIGLELRGSAGLEDAVSDMAAALEASAERERGAGRVLVGPHLDDLLFTCRIPAKGNEPGDDSERPAASALSRGQKRRVVVAAILAAGHLIETRLRLKPILLLDDVAAELDAEGKELMGQALAATGWQVFVTGVEDPFKIPGSAAWQISEGDIQGS